MESQVSKTQSSDRKLLNTFSSTNSRHCKLVDEGPVDRQSSYRNENSKCLVGKCVCHSPYHSSRYFIHWVASETNISASHWGINREVPFLYI